MKIIKLLLNAFVPYLRVGYFDFKNTGAPLSFKTKVTDFLSVLRSLGVYLVFVLLAFLIFVVISPGRDTLLLLIEQLQSGCILSLLCLLTGLFLWSVASEFGVRYSVYVTDNSGKSLSAEQVAWRKFLQRMVAGSCLLLPCIFIMVSLIVIGAGDADSTTDGIWVFLGITFLLVYLLFCKLTHLYFQSYKDWQNQADQRYWFLSSAKLDPAEANWTGKIYGIYNDFVFTLPKPANYLGAEKTNLEPFTNYFELASNEERDGFPQNPEDLIQGVAVPGGFTFKKFESSPKKDAESFRWIYLIPLTFYKTLHKQLRTVFLFSIILLLAISFIPADWGVFEHIGAPGLLCGAFACWIGVYAGVLYVDFAKLRKSWFPFRLFLVVLFCASSYYNNDHPARLNEARPADTRVDFKTHFDKWFTNYKKEVDASSGQTNQKYPVVFICAEGGAFRTGAYAAIFLDRLKKRLADANIDFNKSVYAMSGVSGGTVGLAYYNAENYLNKPSDFKTQKTGTTNAEQFFLKDCIAPIIGKMFYSEVLNYFIPVHIKLFDRGIALEQAWEDAYCKILKKGATNTFKNDFLNGYKYKDTSKTPLPLLLINTTEVESGNQCWISNVRPGNIIFNDKRDLLLHKIPNYLNYSTAVNFSSRFPLFSPGAMLPEKDSCGGTYKLHYVDGGYYENTGSASMIELLNQIKLDPLGSQVYPIVIYLRFSNDPATQTNNINFGNELTEIVSGIYDTRNGHTYMAVQQLDTLTKYFNSPEGAYRNGNETGKCIDEPLAADLRDVPMNWVLSNHSMKNLKKFVDERIVPDKGVLPMIIKCGYKFPRIK